MGKHSAGQQAAAGLAKIGLALRHQAWKDTGPRGLTPTQAQVLALLRARPTGTAGISEVAQNLAVSIPTASDAVAALVRKGLVRKRRGDEDGRAVRLALTARGRREARRLSEWPDFLLGAVDELSPPEQAVFLRVLVKIVRSLQEGGRIPVSRMCVTCRFFRSNVYDDPQRPHHCDFADAPFGDRELRIDCDDHEPALVIDGQPFHINFGADLSALK